MIVNVPGVIVDGTTPLSASPARADLVVYQGQDTSVVVTVTGSNGTAVNVTGYTATLTVKDRLLPATGAPKYSKTYTGTLTTPASGVITFTIPGSDLKAMNLQSYFWDVFITSGTGSRDEVVPTGLVTVNASIGA